MQQCPLCKSQRCSLVFTAYHKCARCTGIFLSPENFLSPNEEKARYLQHNNDIFDPAYRKFTSPITQTILRDFTGNHRGLDFGAGPGPVISQVLQEHQYHIVQYDPFFHNSPHLLDRTYDYIACCEVIEHFYDPAKEFHLLKNLLNPGGWLYCMTHLWEESMDFAKWYYKNDPTHVFFYTSGTMEWIAEHFGFTEMTVNERMITFRN